MPPTETERGSRGSHNPSFQVAGALASLGPDDTEEWKVLEAALKKAKIQAAVPPVEDQEREVPRTRQEAVGSRRHRPKQIWPGCGRNIEEPKTEVQQLRARVAQLEEIWGRHVRGSEEAAEHIRTKAAKRRVGGCAEDVLPSTEQDLACGLDDRQTELWDALDMADMESAAPSQASSPGGSPSALSNMVP